MVASFIFHGPNNFNYNHLDFNNIFLLPFSHRLSKLDENLVPYPNDLILGNNMQTVISIIFFLTNILIATQQAHDVDMTSYQRRHRRRYDVIMMSCARWEIVMNAKL